MNFKETYVYLKNQVNSGERNIISPAGSHIRWEKFSSLKTGKSDGPDYLKELRNSIPGVISDADIYQNREFIYPVFTPAGKDTNNRAILLLHGLNERKWDKYLPWADYLASKTGKSVILFPISFHINRSLPEWTDRHIMQVRSEERKKKFSLKDSESTLINEAISERLTDVPERLFLSGLQTAEDIISLLHDIHDGNHSHFLRGTKSDIFAYSIGGLLAQVLFMSNPDELFSDSKLFLFCAGSLFGDMNGISRLIMDPIAHFKLQDYYKNELETEIKKSWIFKDFFNNNKIGMAFRSMIAQDRFSNLREKIFRKKKEMIYAISLKNDRIIPAAGISKILLGSASCIPSNMEVMDFPYPYSHEMPFPVKQDSILELVNEAFERVFSKAAVFLS